MLVLQPLDDELQGLKQEILSLSQRIENSEDVDFLRALQQHGALTRELDQIFLSEKLLAIVTGPEMQLNIDELQALSDEIYQQLSEGTLASDQRLEQRIFDIFQLLFDFEIALKNAGTDKAQAPQSDISYVLSYIIFMPLIFWGAFIFYLFRLAQKNKSLDGAQKYDLSLSEQDVQSHLEFNDKISDFLYDGIAIVDEDGMILRQNKAFKQLLAQLGLDDNATKNLNWSQIFPNEWSIDLKNEVMDHLDHQGDFITFKTVELANARKIYLRLSFYRLNEKDLSFILIIRDVSEMKESERENAELRKQFFQAQKMESIGRMTGGIAHDFNNILSAIIGYAEFLEDDLPAESEEHRFAKKIMDASEQAKTLINRILSFSRKHTGEKIPIDLVHIGGVIRDMIMSSSSESIEVQFSQNINDAFILGNPTEISQVLMNLCVNARDAMEGKSGTLLIDIAKKNPLDIDYTYFEAVNEDDADAKSLDFKTRVVNESSAKTYVYSGCIDPELDFYCVTIKDTGTGILPAIIEQIFEPFFTTKDQDKGTGLGLSSSLGIVRGHNGLMKVTSTIGEGTSFELFFPVERAYDASMAPSKTESSDEQTKTLPEKTHKADANNLRIILVDDDNVVRETLRVMLERLGHEVTDFERASSALEYAAHHISKHDVLITDYMMPEMKGGELCQKVHKIAPELPMMIISGYAEESFEDGLSDFPYIKAFLTKPIKKHMIAKTLKEIFS